MQTIDLSPAEWRELDEQPLLDADYAPSLKSRSLSAYLIAFFYIACLSLAAGGPLTLAGSGVAIVAAMLMLPRAGERIERPFWS